MTTIGDLIKSGVITTETVVLGELEFTADRCVVANGAFKVWRLRGNSREVVGPEHMEQWPDYQWNRYYTTTEAAEAARKEGCDALDRLDRIRDHCASGPRCVQFNL